MRRVLNSFLQFLEQDQSASFIIAATNNIHLLDQALFRRFDDVLFYTLPNKQEAIELIRNKLSTYKYKFSLEGISEKDLRNLSHAEIAQACDDTIKEVILSDQKMITKTLLTKMLKHRQEVYEVHNK